jgi:hypothetical protein
MEKIQLTTDPRELRTMRNALIALLDDCQHARAYNRPLAEKPDWELLVRLENFLRAE